MGFFISYAREDERSAAKPIAEELERRNFKIWVDRKEIADGEPFEDKLLAGLRNCHYGIVILSSRFLEKEWPKRELDLLLSIEQVDVQSRIVFVLHQMATSELQTVAPKLAARTPISTNLGAQAVCDKVLEAVLSLSARRHKDHSSEIDPKLLYPRFRAIGVLKCTNQQCSWKVSAEILEVVFRDPGPLDRSLPYLKSEAIGMWCAILAGHRRWDLSARKKSKTLLPLPVGEEFGVPVSRHINDWEAGQRCDQCFLNCWLKSRPFQRAR